MKNLDFVIELPISRFAAIGFLYNYIWGHMRYRALGIRQQSRSSVSMIATHNERNALVLTIMHGKRALFKFQNGVEAVNSDCLLKVLDLKFLFCLRIHTLPNRTMNSKCFITELDFASFTI